MLQFGTGKGFLQIHTRMWVALTLRTQSYWTFSVKYNEKEISERVVVSCYRFLGVISFVLNVRSWSSNNVTIYLYQMNVIFCLSCTVKRGQSFKAQISPCNVPSWISRNRSHLAAPSEQGAHILHSSHPWWSQAPNPTGPVSSGCPSEETSSQRLRPRKMATASRLQSQGWGRGSPLLKAWGKATGGQ